MTSKTSRGGSRCSSVTSRGGSRCSSVTCDFEGGVVGVVLCDLVSYTILLREEILTGGTFTHVPLSHGILPLIKKSGNPDGGDIHPCPPLWVRAWKESLLVD